VDLTPFIDEINVDLTPFIDHKCSK